MRYLFLLLFFAQFMNITYSQRFSTGVTCSLIGYQNLKYEDQFVFSPNSYMIYYAGNEKRNYKPAYGQSLNGIGLGFNFNIDYKRYMLNLEFLGGTKTIKTSLIAPSGLNDLVYGTNTVDFKIAQIYTSIGLLGFYKLSTKANGLFIQLGMNVSFNKFEEEKDMSTIITFNLSPNEMYGALYTNNYTYFNGLAGLGWKWNDTYLSARFSKSLFTNTIDSPSATFYQLDLVLSKLLNFQKMKKGYIIFLEK